MIVTNLRVEYLENPRGLEEGTPRLYWQTEVSGENRGFQQSAYQIRVSSKRNGEEADLWESGWVESGESTHIEYQGCKLESRVSAHWQVRVRDTNGTESAWSEEAWWEMGLLHQEDWSARWIEGPQTGSKTEGGPAPFLRKEFNLGEDVASARLYVSALGLYRCRLNGERVGTGELLPGWTDYTRRVPYQTYDVTEQLQSGANALAVSLGDGWYCGNLAWYEREFYGTRPSLLAQLEVTYRDGSREVIATDQNWRVSLGPILKNDLMMGEIHDARLELTGWDRPGYADESWARVTEVARELELSGVVCETVRVTMDLSPVAAPVRRDEKRYIFDLGQNISGRVKIRLNCPAGTQIVIRHAEALKEDGELYVENLRRAKATDIYYCRGGGEEVWEPSFTIHGFRFVELEGLPYVPDESTLVGRVMHTGMDLTGSFSCSDPLINQLQSNITWSQRDNLVEVPTDCPQRDERLGWTGDAHIFIGTATFNMNVAAFFTKWLRDLRDAQNPDGSLPVVAPNPNVFESRDGGPGWSEAIIICPWVLYQQYGDKRILERCYDAGVAQLRYLEERAKCHLVYLPDDPGWEGYGDWLAMDGSADYRGLVPKDLVGTAFYAYSVDLMARISKVLGKTMEQERYAALFDNIRDAYQRRYITSDGFVMGNTQSAYVWTLHFGLAPENLRSQMAKNLKDDIRRRGNKLSTGFLGVAYLMHVLSKTDSWDEAGAVLMQKEIPSWLYAVCHGATTIWERWNGWTAEDGFFNPSMNSFNHYAYGSVGEWIYKHIGGLQLAEPGYKKFILMPELVAQIDQARLEFRSLHGTITFAWESRDEGFSCQVEIPPNTTADLFLPISADGTLPRAIGGGASIPAETVEVRAGKMRARYQLGSGNYSFLAQGSGSNLPNFVEVAV